MNASLPSAKARPSLRTFLLFLLPIALLAGVIALFLSTGGGLELQSLAPVESLSIERYTLEAGRIEIYVRNTGPQEITLAQAIVNAAVWPFEVTPGATIPRLGRAVVRLNYPWSYGEAYEVTLFSANAIAFGLEIPLALPTAQPSTRMLLGFTLIGLYVGVIPIFLGFVWLPALRQLGRHWMVFLMAITAGLLIFLGLDTLVEALEMAAKVGGPFQGIGLVGIGGVATFMLLEAISQRQHRAGHDEASQRVWLAYMIAAGIGLHNLGEGLAIGAAYNVGKIALGAFLVVGFIIQNITEGLGIIAPILRQRPRLGQLTLLGLIGGAPAIAGAWVGGFAPSPVLGVVFFAIGVGAIFEVVYEVARLIQKDIARQPMPITVFSGVLVGMLLLWVTGLWIK